MPKAKDQAVKVTGNVPTADEGLTNNMQALVLVDVIFENGQLVEIEFSKFRYHAVEHGPGAMALCAMPVNEIEYHPNWPRQEEAVENGRRCDYCGVSHLKG